MVEEGFFRNDLYYRLNVFPIEVPALRDRSADIPLLVWHFVRKYAKHLNKHIEVIRDEDMGAMVHYHWPGNIRELQNLIERSVILSSDCVLNTGPLANIGPPAEIQRVRTKGHSLDTTQTLAQAERACILNALRDTEWVVGGVYGAAVRLGVKRTTLLDKMRRHGIFRPQNSLS
jgi:formate hydrogenlyase transcriptional activator